jgi:hypothetical protein
VNDIRQKVFSLIESERDKQDEKWGIQNHEPQYWTGILGEEFGEYCQAVTETVFDNSVIDAEDAVKGGTQNIIKELVQVAAVAVAAIECLLRNEVLK